MKKYTVLLTAGLSIFIMMLFPAFMLPDPDWNEIVAGYEQYPPIATSMSVQKLEEPLQDESNVIMWIQYEEDSFILMPPTLNIYYGENGSNEAMYVTFRDDGVAPDDTEGDREYAAYIEEDLSDFAERIEALYTETDEAGGYMKYTGHVGEFIEEVNQFDVYGFEHFERVDLPDWVRRRGFPCESLTKQNSLFITDLDVVEDPSRTFFVHLNDLTTNPTIGNPTGVWTFGHLVQNIVNTTQTGVTTKNF